MPDEPRLIDLGPPRVDPRDPARAIPLFRDYFERQHSAAQQVDADRLARIQALEGQVGEAVSPTTAQSLIDSSITDLGLGSGATATVGTGASELPTNSTIDARRFQSASQDILTGDQTYEFDNDFGDDLFDVSMWLQCTTADLGYSVGVLVKLSNGFVKTGGSNVWSGTNIEVSTAKITVHQEGSIHIPQRTTKFLTQPTYSNWQMFVRGWK